MTRDELAAKVLPFAEVLALLLEAEDDLVTTAAARAALELEPTPAEWAAWIAGDPEATPWAELHATLLEVAGIPGRPEDLQ